VLLRFLRVNDNNNTRVEITCHEAADWLPVQLRAGNMQDGEWSLFIDFGYEWKKASGVWYPSRHVKTAYFGIDHSPVQEIDLTVRNVRANGAANVLESVFSLTRS
jgi:hypothetical protein